MFFILAHEWLSKYFMANIAEEISFDWTFETSLDITTVFVVLLATRHCMFRPKNEIISTDHSRANSCRGETRVVYHLHEKSTWWELYSWKAKISIRKSRSKHALSIYRKTGSCKLRVWNQQKTQKKCKWNEINRLERSNWSKRSTFLSKPFISAYSYIHVLSDEFLFNLINLNLI